jgi:hypothetical protein
MMFGTALPNPMPPSYAHYENDVATLNRRIEEYARQRVTSGTAATNAVDPKGDIPGEARV